MIATQSVAPLAKSIATDSLLAQVLTLVPRTARRVLDIGCGTGLLGKVLKNRQPAEVVGLVSDPGDARIAWDRLDQVVVRDLDAFDDCFAAGQFDCIVCLDILPFVREPGALLHRAQRWLASRGQLIASIPNVRHHRLVADLLEGRWSYRVDGAARHPQLRFFTRRETEKLFYRAGFAVPKLMPLPDPELETWHRQGRPALVQVGALHIGGLSVEEAEEFYVSAYLVRAVPSPTPADGLTSIVIVTHNQLEYTRQCVDSIRLRTDEPYELIFVDNGSTDGTVDYLHSLPAVKVLCNPDNRGFPAAVNQGIQVATGAQVLLLNNDTLVTTGWLRRLLNALYSSTSVGLVGPCSNSVSGEQQVAVRYDDDLVGLDGFAWEWGKAHDRVREDSDRLVGFCLLVRRDVVDQIGLLDERFGIGCYEDDDYCLRALNAGYRAVIARDAFVHHFGGRTFVGTGVDFAALMKRNRQLFIEKWKERGAPAQRPEIAKTAISPTPRTKFALKRAVGGGLLLALPSVRLSLCMIVRDAARTLRACLESIRPWVDEMVVVDTGSLDDTAQVAAELGARVFHFPWCDSFSAARNESLRHAQGDWVFWMDADDVIDAANGAKLRELAAQDADPALLGYVLQVHCPGAGEDGQADITVVDHVKLFRNRPQLRFEGRIHEQILPAIRRLGGKVAWSDIFVRHDGYDHSPAGQQKKLARDLHLLHRELSEQPEHPFTLFNLGMTYADQGDHAQAVAFLQRSLAHAGPGESHLRKVYALLVFCHAQLGQMPQAREMCDQGLALFPRDAELRFRKALLLQEAGELREAARLYQELLASPDERHFCSVDRGIHGFKTRQNLALVYADLGDVEEAEAQWRLVVQEMPRYRSGWRGLAEVLLRQQKHQEVSALAETLLADSSLHSEGHLLRGQLAAAVGDVAAARRELEAAAIARPADPEPWRVLGKLLFDQADLPEAEKAHRALLERAPGDPAAHANLATIFLRQGRYQEAVAAYRESLALRPDSATTYAQFGEALCQAGCEQEAVTAWERARQLDPANPVVEEALTNAGRNCGVRAGD